MAWNPQLKRAIGCEVRAYDRDYDTLCDVDVQTRELFERRVLEPLAEDTCGIIMCYNPDHRDTTINWGASIKTGCFGT